MRTAEPSVADLRELFAQAEHGVEYQPIVAVADGSVLAYEALARFRDRHGRPLRPDRVFQAFHSSPLSLFELELRVKQGQIRHAPPGQALFLNIDLDAFAAYGGGDGNPLLDLFTDRDDLVVEIIENCSVADARISLDMLQCFRQRRLRLALDDIGARETLVSFDVLAGVDYLKLARDWLGRRGDAGFAALLRALCNFAHDTGKAVIFEGIETPEQLAWARDNGADFVQGFLFRDRFVSYVPEGDKALSRELLA